MTFVAELIETSSKAQEIEKLDESDGTVGFLEKESGDKDKNNCSELMINCTSSHTSLLM